MFRDLCIYAQAHDLDVRAFQDAHGNELDCVLVKGTEWAGLEIKLSSHPDVVDSAAKGLTAIARRMKSTPRFLAVVTATGPSYVRPDSVAVLPISALAP